VTLRLPPTSGLKLHLAAWQPNGIEGAGLVSGQGMATWTNRGTGVADGVQNNTAHQPQWKAARNRWPAVQFDSVSDRIDIPSSASTLAFIHETAVFDIFLAFRPSANKAMLVCGNAYNTGDKGFVVERNQTIVGSPITFYLFLGPGEFRSFTTNNFFTASFEPGVANKLLFRAAGVGSRLQGSNDFETIYSTTGNGTGATLPTLPTGDATADCQIGAQNSANFYGGEILDVAIYNRNLSTVELNTMSAYFNERYGI